MLLRGLMLDEGFADDKEKCREQEQKQNEAGTRKPRAPTRRDSRERHENAGDGGFWNGG
ncbi:hypothetical protein LX36DRAFT_653727 [Colletotrichum falcatum]|nr:hypothetical protein LX36DRAFT_653727 [Colletotrichum falcatum]